MTHKVETLSYELLKQLDGVISKAQTTEALMEEINRNNGRWTLLQLLAIPASKLSYKGKVEILILNQIQFSLEENLVWDKLDNLANTVHTHILETREIQKEDYAYELS